MYLMGVHLIGVCLMRVSHRHNLMGVYHGMQPVLLSRTYVFAAFDGRWPGIAFLILALSGNFGGFSFGPSAPAPKELFTKGLKEERSRLYRND